MKLRLAITIAALILYVGLFDVYIFRFLDWSPYFDKLFYNWLTLGTWVFVLLDWKLGFVNDHHRRFNLLIFMSVLTNYLFVILTTTEFFYTKHPQIMFYSFDGTMLAITVTVFFNEIRYKIFNE